MFPSFKYLGRVLSTAYDYWPVVILNLEKARAVWQRMSRILGREGESPQVPGFSLKPLSSRLWSSVQRRGWLPPHGTGPGIFPILGGEVTEGGAAMAEVRREVGVHLRGGGKRGGRVWDDGNLPLSNSEYGCAVYCDTTNSGHVQFGGEGVVGTGITWPVRGKGEGDGGGRWGWTGGIRGGGLKLKTPGSGTISTGIK